MKRRVFMGAMGASALSAAGLSIAWAAEDSRESADGRSDSLAARDRNRPGSPTVPAGNASGRIVVIGGGMGGASAAKFLRLWGGPNLAVSLIERESKYVSNIMSNLVLNGSRTVESLSYGYDALVNSYGVKRILGDVSAIEHGSHSVRLADGQTLPYDRLVVAPGIEFDTIPGLETPAAQAQFPHAWKAGAQTTALRDQIRAMPRGGTFIMTIPAAPYRCPPGPYERACLVADFLKTNNPGSKVIVLDANPGITAEVDTFTTAFQVTYAGIISYVPNAAV